jgi:pyruvate dehydrogenase E2 component (dihydrolipoamide acetyltransferase)
VTQHDLFDVTELELARQHQQKQRTEESPKLSLTVLVLKAVLAALKRHPRFNASFDAARGEIIIKHYYHLGVAVDTEQGLIVPVLHNADRRSTLEIAAELRRLVQRAKQRELTIEELQGSSFSISNQGMLGGGVAFSPIINPPEVAILGISRLQQRPNAEGKTRLWLPLSLSYDHRVNNGGDAVRFLTAIGQALADPFRLLLES